MKILVSGSHGLVGNSLVESLILQGHQVVRLARANPAPDQIVWDPQSGIINQAELEGFAAVVHLAGDNIASGRWTASKKDSIRNSRLVGTKTLCQALACLEKPPEVLVSASAIGYYGHRGDEILTEDSQAGTGFLAEVCRDWELATRAAQEANIRTVNLRIGVVLSPKGGALTKMLLPFQMGAGGKLGSGKQFMSWIGLPDLLGSINHALINKELVGPVNAVTPNTVTNDQFTSAFGAALHRPTILPMPAFAARLLLGQMADELLLASQRVVPQRLLASNYAFLQPELAPMLRQVLSAD